MSLTVLLLSGFAKTIAQTDHVGVTIAEIRKANQTKARLDSAHAAGKMILSQVKGLKDSLNIYKDSTGHWHRIALLETRRKKGWRKLAIISVLVNIAENSILFLRRK